MRALWRRIVAAAAQLLSAHLTPVAVAQAVAIGVFIGCLPIYGVHIFLCIALARRLRLNQAVLYGAANVSNPLFAPFLVLAEIAVGDELRGVAARPELGTDVAAILAQGGDVLWSCILGSIAIGAVLSTVLALAAYVAARRWLPAPAPAG